MEIPVSDITPAQWRTGLSRAALAETCSVTTSQAPIDLSELEITVIASFEM
jgi:hypothetical protein